MKDNYKGILGILFLIATAIACNKATNQPGGNSLNNTEETVIKDFVNEVALSQYNSLVQAATNLDQALNTLNANPTDANLLAAQNTWRTIRSRWEQCEGFLFGPVEDQDYDPNTDTWPTDYTQMDSLLASNNPLQPADIRILPQSLRGYHPIEYIIFGVGGSRTATSLTSREKQYMLGLSADLLNNNVQPLYDSWASAPTNYADEVMNAGKGSKSFATRKELFLVMVSAMSDICEEVGAGKMLEPFAAKDSTITESPYSGNTLTDFKDNIIGLQTVYVGANGSAGLKELVAAKNKSLDNQIRNQISTAINSFDNITLRYEQAIFDQRVQIQQTMDQLAMLKNLLENDLTDFIKQNVKD